MSGLFYQPEFSVYKFFKLYFAILKQQNIHDMAITKSEIIKQLYKAKCSGNYPDLLDEFSFFDNGLFISSNQVEEGIFQMQLSGIIARKTQSAEFIIALGYRECKNIINSYKIDKVEKMEKLIGLLCT